MRPTFIFIAVCALLLPAACMDRPAQLSGGVPNEQEIEKIDWGREVKLDELMEMAKRGRIQEIQWYVMPNVIRAVASGGRAFYLKNENRGVDLRKLLIDAGIHIGKGGINFRHVFCR
jgi:hypothetical protein